MTRDRPLAVPVLAALFVASGATGLVYESIWAAYLRLFLGHAAYAQAVVLVVFIGGMALGSFAIGAVAERIRRPLLAYAAVEAAIGVFALGFHPIFVNTTSWAYSALLPGVCTADSMCFASFILAALLILPAAILLGATFPLMTAGVLRLAPARAGERIALFYAVNSFGAVGGVLAGGLVLVPAFGLPGAILTAGLANFAVAIGTYVVDGGVSAKAPAVPVPTATPLPVAGAGRRLLLAVAAITGATSFVYEIIWIRLLSLVLGASTHSFELMLAAFILGIALGSLWIRRRIDTLRSPLAALGAVQVLMGAFALGTLPLYAQSFPALAAFLTMLAPTPGGYGMFMLFGGALSVAIMLPVTVLAGMTLPLLTAMLLRGPLGERAIGWVYAANTVGSIAGVLVGVNVALPLLGAKHGLAAAALADIALGLLLLARARRQRGSRRLAVGSIAAAAVLCAVGFATALDPLVLSSGVYRTGVAQADDGTRLVFHRDGRTATVDVLRSRDGVLALRTNGKTDASLTADDARTPEVSGDEATQVLLAALPLLHRPDAREVAVVGFGSGMTSAMLLEAPGVREVVTVEIEPAVVDGAHAFLPRTARAHEDPRSRIVMDDAKSYFARAARRFDVIVSEPSNPWVSGTSSLFTAEFYAHVARTLAPGGVFAQWIHTYEFDSMLLASVLKALQSQFDDFVIYETDAGDLVIVATVDGRVPEPRRDVLEFGAMGAALRAVGIGSVEDFSRLAVAQGTTADLLTGASNAPVNSDYFPFVDLNAARARFMRTSADEIRSLRHAPVPLLDLVEQAPLRKVLSTPRPASEPIQSLARAAYAERTAAYASGLASGASSAAPPGNDADLAALGAVFGDCVRPEIAAVLWDRIVVLAAETIPLLPAQEAESMWLRLADGACAARLPARERRWLALFVATAARDAPAMRRAAEPLLGDAGNTPAQWQYVVAAAGAGAMAMKDVGGVIRLLRDYGPRLPPQAWRTGWFAVLSAYSGLPVPEAPR